MSPLEPTKKIDVAGILSNRVLVGNSVRNFVGYIGPMVVALITIPIIIESIGIDRFGVLSLSWMAIGYLAIFDLGLGRALTNLVASQIGHDQQAELPSLIWTASAVMLVFGLFSSVLMFLFSPLLVNSILRIPAELKGETLDTFYLIALSIPVVVSTSGTRGVLEALQRFDYITNVRIFLGIITFLGPIFVLPFTKSVFWITALLVVARLVAWLVYVYLCVKALPSLKKTLVFDKNLIKPLLKFGGWMTVSNIISPVMVSADRFFIGSLLSIGAVSYYSAPWEIVTKYLLIPASIMGVLFPAFSTAMSQDLHRVRVLYKQTFKIVFACLLPITLITILLAKPGLSFWLGDDFSVNSYRVMQILAVGVFFNGLAYIPYALIQGAGRPDITAKFHMLEAVLYIPGIIVLIDHFGIAGAAMAWTLRAIIDSVLLMYAAHNSVGLN